MIKWRSTFSDYRHIADIDGIEVVVSFGLLGGWKIGCPELGFIGGIPLRAPKLEDAKVEALRKVRAELLSRIARDTTALDKLNDSLLEIGMEGSK